MLYIDIVIVLSDISSAKLLNVYIQYKVQTPIMAIRYYYFSFDLDTSSLTNLCCSFKVILFYAFKLESTLGYCFANGPS